MKHTASRIGVMQELGTRGLVPTHVNMMALTATATHRILQVVCQHLSLKDVAIVALPPNIMYKSSTITELTSSLSVDLRRQGVDFPKTLILCQTYQDCSQLYMVIRKKLGGPFTCPQNYPDLHQFRVVDLYTRVSTVPMREK